MFLSFKLATLDNDLSLKSFITDTITKADQMIPYDNVGEGQTPLYLYFKQVEQNKTGKLVTVFYDIFVPIRVIEETTHKLITTGTRYSYGPINIQVFEVEPLQDFIAILAGNQVSIKVIEFLSRIVQKRFGDYKTPFHKVQFSIQAHQNDIRNIPDFTDVSEVVVEDIGDEYIGWAWIKGAAVDQSMEYKKFVESSGSGKITALGFRYNGKTYYIYNDGRIFTKEAEASLPSEIAGVHNISKKLRSIGIF